ncbi:MAG: hypothetical protein J6Y47_02865 [Bacteroidales bacterium]|nr:hypothetical protein [Bacteroidales bacterium]
MGKRIFIYACIALLLCACSLRQQSVEKKLKATIIEYMQANVDGLQVDSVLILGQDSLNDMDFAYMNKIVLQNAQEEIENNYLLYIEPETPDERVDQFELNKRLEWIKTRINYWDSVMLDDNTDTIRFQYYFVSSRVYGKIGQTSQTYEIGFPISADFKVQELQLWEQEE